MTALVSRLQGAHRGVMGESCESAVSGRAVPPPGRRRSAGSLAGRGQHPFPSPPRSLAGPPGAQCSGQGVLPSSPGSGPGLANRALPPPIQVPGHRSQAGLMRTEQFLELLGKSAVFPGSFAKNGKREA